jgi:hypothetical protein
MVFNATPGMIRKMAEDYARANALIHVSRDEVRATFARWPVLRQLFALRDLVRLRRR